MDTDARILFAGGTTGGHLFPGVAVAEQLQREGTRIGFAGTGRRLERRVAAQRGYEFLEVPAVSSRDLRRRPWQALRTGRQSWQRARQALVGFRPSGVVGLGGFASIPVVLAAAHAGIPVTLLEQNVIPGRATRWLSRRATSVCVTFPETIGMLPRASTCRVTGNPVRNNLASVAGCAPVERVVVLGGSQGARRLNEAVPRALRSSNIDPSGWEVLHQCGESPIEPICDAYRDAGWRARVVPFLEAPEDWLPDAGLVIARAGGTTLAELACVGCASILVPYPHATDNHQRANARWFSERLAAVVVEEAHGDVFRRRLGIEVGALMRCEQSRGRLAANIMRLGMPHAAVAVAEEVQRLVPALQAA